MLNDKTMLISIKLNVSLQQTAGVGTFDMSIVLPLAKNAVGNMKSGVIYPVYYGGFDIIQALEVTDGNNDLLILNNAPFNIAAGSTEFTGQITIEVVDIP